MRLLVKLCGVTDRDGIEAARLARVDAVGFVFADSPRRLEPAAARELARALPRRVVRVAVFHHPTPDEVRAVLAVFPADVVQCEPSPALAAGGFPLPVFHDGDDVQAAIAAYRADHGHRAPVLLEGAGRGGRGVRADRARAATIARGGRTALAGGLDPGNVARAVARVRPWAVDVSSGVEFSPGRKDPDAVVRFVREARRAARDPEALSCPTR